MGDIETFLGKGRSGWEASSTVPYDPDNKMFMRVSTYKRPSGGVGAAASVFKREGDFETHRMYQDFYWTVEHDLKMRCTENNVTAMHNRALTRIDEIMQRAKLHYLAVATKAA